MSNIAMVDAVLPVICFIGKDSVRPPPILLGSFWEEALEREVARYSRVTFKRVSVVEFWPYPLTLALTSDFQVLGEGEQSRSKGSDALYLAQWVLEDHLGILVQILPAAQEDEVTTSAHCHLGKDEVFHRMIGAPIMKIGSPAFRDGVRRIKLDSRPLVVSRGHDHRLIQPAGTMSPALNIIEIRGPDPLGMGDYHPARY
ncbi:MAG: hypothetical protein A2113_02765 [Candidatus Woykebacteria bacterium GWA1_44_8]|uniref:Mannose-6-phosphate isomerase type II C-terminal domain-containing protein n=1 Tax=Candidatus Woykebacteria bacterium GWA1_44_8 TaxID=1802591 RepID=A0A1G1W351_9BACT|nr:MAG: hypothetical protein A2113_02765 [Candidatus Woykebacteria bacterium GWA1_44_8]